MRIYELEFEHRPWSTFGDADKLAPFNPLRRVPTLLLNDGEVLIESGAILDHLDELVGPGRALIAEHGGARRAVLKICALATGVCDKMVSLIYERALHEELSIAWIERCETQVGAVFDALEKDRAARSSAFWFADRLTHADIAVTCAMRFVTEAHASLNAGARWPVLMGHARRCEELDTFASVVQAFDPPKRR